MFFPLLFFKIFCLWLIITSGSLIVIPLAGCHADVVQINLQHDAGLTLKIQLYYHCTVGLLGYGKNHNCDLFFLSFGQY